MTGGPAPTGAFVRFESGEIEQAISDRFESQVRRTPDRIAVQTATTALSYAQLNARANQVARTLIAHRGTASEPVALLFDQGLASTVATLGCLKAGKIYVPLDPRDAAAHHVAVLADATAAVLLADAAHLAAARALAPPGVAVLDVDAIDPNTATADLEMSPGPDRLAYIFYTSGTTGRPKGVADTHRNVLHNVLRYTNTLHITAADRLTLLQAPSFSGAVSSLFAALLNGATSCPFDLRREGPERLGRWVREMGITIFHSVPSLFRLLADGRRDYPALRVIRLEGDRAAPRDVALYHQHLPNTCVLVNGLGATECGLVRQYFITKDTPVPEGAVPVGYAVPDMEVVLLDDAGRPVEGDAVGEIVVRSRYLAPGYWRRPDLTAVAFAEEPDARGMRRYRTGDLGRLRADGCLEHLGRLGVQLRVRGRWVDIPAIEEALRALGGGRFADVVVHPVEDRPTEPRLVAYLVPVEGQPAPPVDELRTQLGARLPVHMIPAAFVALAALPLSPNGKVDRRALPAPGHARPELRAPYTGPRHLLERQLVHIWEEVLRVAPVGIRDGFFDLGGDSLDAVTMILRVEEATGKTLPPDVLLTAATIEDLARHLRAAGDDLATPLVEIQQGTSGQALYFLHGVYASVGYYSVPLARLLGPERPFYALPPCGANGFPVPDTYAEMARVHIEILRARQPHGPYLLGGTCNGGLVAYEMARQLVAAGERVDGLILIAASAANRRFAGLRRAVSPFALASPRLARRAFVRLQPFWAAWGGLPPARRLGFLARKVGRLPSLARDLARAPAGPAPSADAAAPEAATGFRSDLRERYHRIDKEYLPGPYPGRVTLFWWEGEGLGPDAEARWWRSITAGVELHRFPGKSHVEALTRDLGTVAARLKACCEAADQGGSRLA